MSDKLKVLDLFSGIGMFSYGLEKTGLYETVAFCEWDGPCQEVLKKHWPGVEVFGDIKNLEGHRDTVKWCYNRNPAKSGAYDLYISRSVDVITGGFPCQDISSANMSGEGVKGSKSGHWSHMHRLISEIRPKGVIIENVPRLAQRGLDRVLHDLAQIGYDAEWYNLKASDFGAPCKKERIFIVAHPPCIRWEDALSLGEAYRKGQKLHSERDLQEVCNNPFGQSGGIPKPLFRGMDVSNSSWVDRLKQVGNTVYWPIVEQLGYHLYDNIKGNP